MASSLRLVEPNQHPGVLYLERLVALRQAMQAALHRADWPQLQRLDRLCGQTLQQLSGDESTPQTRLLKERQLWELGRIQHIYAEAIGELDQQMATRLISH